MHLEPSRDSALLDAAARAVVYGLPLVMMDVTMRKATNTVHPRGFTAPVNQFAHVRQFPTAAFKDVVRANVDTLYSSAFLDLADEPVVLSMPETRGRYGLLPIMDAWTNVVASPGTRTTGSDAANLVITGPGWRGTLPAGLREVRCPTRIAWILGRTQTNGPDDYAAVHALQDGYRLAPLSRFGTGATAAEGTVDPAVDMDAPPVEQVRRMGATTFFGTLARLLATNPAPAEDAPVLAALARLGVRPGEPFDAAALADDMRDALEHAIAVAFDTLQDRAALSTAPVNGWRIPPSTLGHYGTDYAMRGLIALIAFGANLPADAVYPTAFVDADGQALTGAKRYVLRFPPGRTPPVKAFWSITLYDEHSFFVDNPIDRYAISSWMPLQRSADGAIELHVQNDSPGAGRESNWLPSPVGAFNLTLRMYWPNAHAPSILDGTWAPPGLTVCDGD